MTDNWDSYFCTVEGRPASMLVNLGLAQAAPLAGYPVSAYVSVFLKAPDQHGFPGEDEYDALSRIEDAFMAAALRNIPPPPGNGGERPRAGAPFPEEAPVPAADGAPEALRTAIPAPDGAPEAPGGVYAGRCATNGRFILFFYLPPAFGGATLEAWREHGDASGGESWGARAEAVMTAFPDYAWEAGAEEDPDWTTYSGFLFPEGFALLGIQNARLLRELAEAGDDTTLSRRIDHFAVFPDAGRAEAFLETLQGLGFVPTGLEEVPPARSYEAAGDVPHDAADEAEAGKIAPGRADTAQAQGGNAPPKTPPAFEDAAPEGVQVRFSRSDAPESMDEVTCTLWDAAAGNGGAYQGWGSPVVQGGDAPGNE